MKNIVTVVFEGPNGRKRSIGNILSVETRHDGSIEIEVDGEDSSDKLGGDWTIRDVYVESE